MHEQVRGMVLDRHAFFGRFALANVVGEHDVTGLARLSSFRTDTVVPPDYLPVLDSCCIPGDPICAGGPERSVDIGAECEPPSVMISALDSTRRVRSPIPA